MISENLLTTTSQDFLDASDFAAMLGMSQQEGEKIVRQIKSISDVFGIKGKVHRVDYLKYIETQLESDVHKNLYDKR